MVALREREFVHEREHQNFAAWVIVFDEKKEKVLLVRERSPRKEGLVGLPGGNPKNSSESLEEAAIRELREETGLRTNTGGLVSYPHNTYLGMLPRGSGDKYYAAKAFICINHEGVKRQESKEAKRIFWARIDKLDRYGGRLSPSLKTVVAQSLNFLNSQS